MSTRKYVRYTRLEDNVFRRQFGVKKNTFNLMVSVLKAVPKSRRGRKFKLSYQDQVLLWLKYIREYITFESVGICFGVSTSTAYRVCIFVENALIQEQSFHLPGKKELLNRQLGSIAIDVSESPIQRPKKNQKYYYSGKKKKHTIKSQITANTETRKILSSATSSGRQHDFKLFKNSKTSIHPDNTVLVDSGYQGIDKLHSNSLLPKKNTKYRKLFKLDKLKNKALASKRIVIENIFALLKRFKIIAEIYRNRRKRFSLRFNLISAIYNLELEEL